MRYSTDGLTGAVLDHALRISLHTCLPECEIEDDYEEHWSAITARGPAAIMGPAHIARPTWLHGTPFVLTWQDYASYILAWLARDTHKMRRQRAAKGRGAHR